MPPGADALALRDALAGAGRGRRGRPHDRRTPHPAPGARTRWSNGAASSSRCRRASRQRGRRDAGAWCSSPVIAGVGKSALVRAFIDGLADDVTVHVGGCDDLVAPRSLGPFQDMVADPAARDSGVRTIVEAGTMPEVLPALLAFLGRGPSVAVVEDLHWADDATLDAMRYLARRVTNVPVVLVADLPRAAASPADHPLTRLLGTLLGDHVVAAAAGTPLGCRCPRPRWLQRRRGHRGASDHRGEPVLRHRGHRRRRRRGPHHGARRRPRQDRRLATRGQGAAADSSAWSRAARNGGSPRPSPRAARHSCWPRRRASCSGDPEGLSFRHELARRAVESSLTTTERRAAHREVLDVLLEGSRGVPGTTGPPRRLRRAATGCWWRSVRRRPPRRRAKRPIASARRSSAWSWRARTRCSDQLAAKLWSERSYSSYVVNRFEAAFTYAETAVALADRAGDRQVLMDALPVLARAAMFARGPEAARTAAQRSVDVSRR